MSEEKSKPEEHFARVGDAERLRRELSDYDKEQVQVLMLRMERDIKSLMEQVRREEMSISDAQTKLINEFTAGLKIVTDHHNPSNPHHNVGRETS